MVAEGLVVTGAGPASAVEQVEEDRGETEETARTSGARPTQTSVRRGAEAAEPCSLVEMARIRVLVAPPVSCAAAMERMTTRITPMTVMTQPALVAVGVAEASTATHLLMVLVTVDAEMEVMGGAEGGVPATLVTVAAMAALAVAVVPARGRSVLAHMAAYSAETLLEIRGE